jgi:hypothetical protein
MKVGGLFLSGMVDLGYFPLCGFLIFAGPPGSGKSSLGEKACHESGIRFMDLSTPAINEQPFNSQKDILTEAINKRPADVIALPWLLQQDKGIRKLVRRSGVILLLRAHPIDMQSRSGHSQSLFTPSPRIKTRTDSGVTAQGAENFVDWTGPPTKS